MILAFCISGENPSLTPIKKMKKYFPLSLFLSKFLTNIFLERNYFTPNSVTLLSFISGIIACLLFLQGTYILGIIGSLFLIHCFILDYVDGFIARKKNLKTKFGYYLDSLNDWLISCLFFVCLGIEVSKTQNSNIFFWMGIAAGIGGTINFIRVMYFNQQSISAKSRQRKHNKYSLWEKTLYFFREECKSDFCFIVLFLALIDQLWILLPLGAIGSQIYWITARFNNFTEYIRDQNWKNN